MGKDTEEVKPSTAEVPKADRESAPLEEATPSMAQVESQHEGSDAELKERFEEEEITESSPSRSCSPGRRSRVSFGEVSVHTSPVQSARTSSNGTDLAGDAEALEESEDSRTASPSNDTDLPSDTTDLPSGQEEDTDQKLEQASVGIAPATPKRDSDAAELDDRSESPKRTKTHE